MYDRENKKVQKFKTIMSRRIMMIRKQYKRKDVKKKREKYW
jgi:hypothetical protein